MIKRLKRYDVTSYFAVAATTIIVFFVFRPDLVFSSSIPTGGDYGGHLEVPHYMLQHLFKHFDLTGWSPDWYDGWPINVFYFPLPSALIALLSYLIPYVIAFKLVVVSGSLLLPLAIFKFVKNWGLTNPQAAFASVASIPYLFNYVYTIDGGNIFSTMAGEYCFSISLAFAFLFLGSFMKDINSGVFRYRSALLFAITLLCHVLGAIFAIFVVASILAVRIYARRTGFRKDLFIALGSGLIGVLLAAWWATPFLVNLRYTTNMGYYPIQTYFNHLFSPQMAWAFYAIIIQVFLILLVSHKYVKVALAWVILVSFVILGYPPGLAALVLVVLIAKERPLSLSLAMSAGIAALLFRFIPTSVGIYNERFLPWYVLAVYLVAALAIYDVGKILQYALNYLRHAYRGPIRIYQFIIPLFLILFLVVTSSLNIIESRLISSPKVILGQTINPNFAQDWINYNLTGYQDKPGYREYKALNFAMGEIGLTYGCGRAYWEYSSTLGRFGTTMALMELPYFTNGCILSQEGLFFESSATTPFHFINQSELSSAPDYAMSGLPYNYQSSQTLFNLGISHLQLLGVKYAMFSSQDMKGYANNNENLTLLKVVGPFYEPGSVYSWNIYRVQDAKIVSPLSCQPQILKSLPPSKPVTIGSWTTAMLPWYLNKNDFCTELLANGPSQLKKVTYNEEIHNISIRPNLVSNTVLKAQSLSFDVAYLNRPILIKISYFPNWHVVGAAGPYRSSPNLMVIFPTSHHVYMYYGNTMPNYIGDVLTIVTLGSVSIFAYIRKKRLNFAK